MTPVFDFLGDALSRKVANGRRPEHLLFARLGQTGDLVQISEWNARVTSAEIRGFATFGKKVARDELTLTLSLLLAG